MSFSKEVKYGDKFGRLTYVSESDSYINPSSGQKIRRCLWVCDCGNEKTIRLDVVTSGGSNSCGCLANDLLLSRNTSHGLSKHKLHVVWRGMIRRCSGKCHNSDHYIGKGICEEWEGDFVNFYNWALDNGYRDGLSIDRIDNNLGYYPENCRFVSTLQNNRNSSQSKIWCVYGNLYESCSDASENLKMSKFKIRRLCGLAKDRNGNFYPAKSNCWAKLKY